jgi:hypothetical protein
MHEHLHRHLHVVRAAVAKQPQRPAKVVQLDVRRRARVEPRRLQPQHTRPAA